MEQRYDSGQELTNVSSFHFIITLLQYSSNALGKIPVFFLLVLKWDTKLIQCQKDAFRESQYTA